MWNRSRSSCIRSSAAKQGEDEEASPTFPTRRLPLPRPEMWRSTGVAEEPDRRVRPEQWRSNETEDENYEQREGSEEEEEEEENTVG